MLKCKECQSTNNTIKVNAKGQKEVFCTDCDTLIKTLNEKEYIKIVKEVK